MADRDNSELRVAIVGSGPAGLFTAEYLTCEPPLAAHIDIFERLPLPFGLLRYGVAPDHPHIRNAAEPLGEVLEKDGVTLYRCVEVGRHISYGELKARYDVVVYATGADADRRLGLPGEDLPGSVSATSFVKWYNGHPESTSFDLTHTREVVVIGAGNVALDVARILVKDPAVLSAGLPMAVHEALSDSAITDVHVVGRRPAQFAKFTTKELREIGSLSGVDVVVSRAEVPECHADHYSATVKRNMKILREWSTRDRSGARRRVHFHFGSSPTAVLGTDRVGGVRLRGERSQSGETQNRVLEAQMVLRAVGYRSRPIADVPFDESTGTIPHANHRVVCNGEVRRGEYAVGWIKRGPTGILGTNRADAEATVEAIKADLPVLVRARKIEPDVDSLLLRRGVRFLRDRSWQTDQVCADASVGAVV